MPSTQAGPDPCSVPVTPSQAPTGPISWASRQEGVRVRGEPLRVRVDDQRHQGERGEGEAERVERGRRDQEHDQRDRRAGPGGAQRDRAGDELTAGGARVAGVDLAVDDPVGRHGEGPGTDHGDRDQAEHGPVDPVVAQGHRGQRGQVGERQREHRVLDGDQAQERARRRRWLPRSQSVLPPASVHLGHYSPVTWWPASASPACTPRSGSLRVASTPALPPQNCWYDAWSRWSTGPCVTTRSCA